MSRQRAVPESRPEVAIHLGDLWRSPRGFTPLIELPHNSHLAASLRGRYVLGARTLPMTVNEPDPRRKQLNPHGLAGSSVSTARNIQDRRGDFGFVWEIDAGDLPTLDQPNMKRAIWRAKKLFAEIIHDITALEGNPFTVPEIQTLLDGITVGGQKVSDAEQVLNQKNAFLHLFDLVESGNFSLTPQVALGLQQIAAHGEALKEGVFLDGKVSISGTDYQPPSGEGKSLELFLEKGFLSMAAAAEKLTNPFEKGMAAFLHVARSQCFWDGNKRTGCLLMNGVLLAAGQDIITIPAAKQLEFNQKMLRFYGSGDGTEMMKFLSKLQIRSKFE